MNRWICLSCLLLLMPLTGIAQPQAPITWGEGRLFPNPYPELHPVKLYATGDTIALQAFEPTPEPPIQVIRTWFSLSGDNGLNWSPWVPLDTAARPGIERDYVSLAFHRSGILCHAEASNDSEFQYGTYSSNDLGISWHLREYLPDSSGYFFEAQRNDTLFATEGDWLTWSADSGRTWSPYRTAGFSAFGAQGIESLALDGGHVHVVSCFFENLSVHDDMIHYTRAPLYEGAFEPLRILDSSIYRIMTARIVFGENNTGVILASGRCSPEADPSWGQEFLNVTRDGGDTWSTPDTLIPSNRALLTTEALTNAGSYWLACWRDSVAAPGFQISGLHGAFSANNARSWYPEFQIEQMGCGGMEEALAQIRGNTIRVYLTFNWLAGQWGAYFAEWEGQIRPDTIAPQIRTAAYLPDEIAQGSTIEAFATALDNDSLWQMQMVLKQQDGIDSVVISLTDRVSPVNYQGTWTVPNDTALWQYYYRAEDMWANVAVYPDTGFLFTHTTGWSSASHFRLLPSTFSVSIFPNPSNSWPSIALSQDWFNRDPVSVTIFNLLGQEVWHHTSNLVVSRFTPEISTGSGLYLLMVSNREHQTVQKMLVLK